MFPAAPKSSIEFRVDDLPEELPMFLVDRGAFNFTAVMADHMKGYADEHNIDTSRIWEPDIEARVYVARPGIFITIASWRGYKLNPVMDTNLAGWELNAMYSWRYAIQARIRENDLWVGHFGTRPEPEIEALDTLEPDA